MSSKELPWNDVQIQELAETIPTPFHLYDEAGIRDSARSLQNVYDWVLPQDGLADVNHFAVKATPNPHILDIISEEGMGADASAGPELELSLAAGINGRMIMFTSNNTDPAEYVEAHQAGAIINLDDINQIDVLQNALGGDFPDTISFRYNPGNRKATGVNAIIGTPEDSKFGIPDEQLEAAYRKAQKLGVKHFGIHTMVASNELDANQHVATARLVFEKVAELSENLGIDFEFANLGGGIGIPYRPEDSPVDLTALKDGVMEAYDDEISTRNLSPLRVITENGRYITGPNGITVFHALSIKDTFHRNAGLDGSTGANGPRPALYDAYHEISVMGKRLGEKVVQRVTGSLCEDNDYFTGAVTKDRELPLIEEGDVVVIHDTGAHWYAMANNYNSKLRAAEWLYQKDDSVKLIRRAETRADLFATLDHPGL